MAKKSLKKNWLNQYVSGTTDVKPVDLTHDENGKTYTYQNVATDETGNVIKDETGQPVIYGTNTNYVGGDLTQASKSVKGHPYLEYKRQFEQSNPKGEYVLNRLWSPGMPMPDDFLVNHPEEFDQEYQNEQDKYVAQQVFKNNPIKKGESRGDYLDRLATYVDENGKSRTSAPLEGILSRNSNQSKSTKENLFHKSWEGIKKLTLDAIDGKDDHLIVQHIINDKNLSKAEKTEALGHYLDPSTLNTVLTTLGNVGDVLSPLMIPFNATTGAAVTSQEGEEGYTPLSAISGDQPANEADIETQIMADPLNLIFPIVEGLELGSKAGNIIKSGNNAFKETKLGQKIEQFKQQTKVAGETFSDYLHKHELEREYDLLRKERNKLLEKEAKLRTERFQKQNVLGVRNYQKSIDETNAKIYKLYKKEQEILNLKNSVKLKGNELITGNINPLVKATEIGKGEIINFNTGEKVSAEVNIPDGNQITFKVNPETKTVEKTSNASSELNVSQDYINTQKENIAHIENLFPGTKVFGSSRGVAEGGLPHISHDYDIFITQEDYDKLVKGKYNHINSIEPGTTETHDIFNGKYGAQGHVDFNIIKTDKNGNAVGTRAREIFRQFHPDEYYEQAAKLNKDASLDDIVIPYTPKQLLEDMNPTVKTVMDAYESTKPKHINRIDSYINYGNPDVVLEAQNQYIKSLVGSKGTLGIQFPEEAFSDIEKNKKILEKIGFIGDHEIVSKDPKKMQAAINDYYINTTTLVRGVNDNAKNALTIWDPSKGGGNSMGAGLNHTTLGKNPLGKTHFFGIKQVGLKIDESLDPLNYIREIEYKTNGLIPFKDSEKEIAIQLLNKYGLFPNYIDTWDGNSFIQSIYNNPKGPEILKEFADQTGKVLMRTEAYGHSSYVSTLKDFDDAIDSLVYGPNRLIPEVKSKLTREQQYKSFIQNISNIDVPTYEKFLEIKNKLDYDSKNIKRKIEILLKERDAINDKLGLHYYRQNSIIEKYNKENLNKINEIKDKVTNLLNEKYIIEDRIKRAEWVKEKIMDSIMASMITGSLAGLTGSGLYALNKKNKKEFYNYYKSRCQEFKIPTVSQSVFEKDIKDRTAEEQRILLEYEKRIKQELENRKEQYEKEFNEIVLKSPDLSYEDFVKEARDKGYKTIASESMFDDFKDEHKKKSSFADGGYVYTPDQESAEKVFYDSLKPLMDNNYYGIEKEKEKEIERLKSEKEKEKIVDYFQAGKNNNFDFTEGMQNMITKEDSDDDNDYFRFSKKETPAEEAKLDEKKQGLVIDDDLNLSDEKARRAYVALVDRFSQLPQTRSRANQMAKMVLAQAALETGNWTSAASQVNNLSGIKYYGQSGRVASNVLAPAAEEKGYRRPYVQYDSPEDWANDMVNTLVKLYPQTLTANTVDEYAKGLVEKNHKYYGANPSVYAKGMKAKLRTMIDPKKSYEKLSSAFEQSVNEYKEKYPNRPVPVINSGLRTTAEQQALYNNRANNPYPVAAPGTSEHEYGRAIDVGFSGNYNDQDYRNFAEIMGTHGVNWLADKDKVHFQLAEFGNGGIIDDDMGQWAHPGEVTRINSRNITMNGVSYPVLGVGANGEQILMHPEQNYIFEQGPVTEYPMKRRGRLKKAKDGGLTQYQNGSTVKPIIVPPGDPRLQSYQDSLSLYNDYTNLKNIITKGGKYYPNFKSSTPVSNTKTDKFTISNPNNPITYRQIDSTFGFNTISKTGLPDITIIQKKNIQPINIQTFTRKESKYKSEAEYEKAAKQIKDFNEKAGQANWIGYSIQEYKKPVRKVLTEGSEGANNVRKQEELVNAGYDITVDGVWGNKSQQAWDDYLDKLNNTNVSGDTSTSNNTASGTTTSTTTQANTPVKPKPQAGRMGELEHHQAGFYDQAGKEWQFVNGKLVPAPRFDRGGVTWLNEYKNGTNNAMSADVMTDPKKLVEWMKNHPEAHVNATPVSIAPERTTPWAASDNTNAVIATPKGPVSTGTRNAPNVSVPGGGVSKNTVKGVEIVLDLAEFYPPTAVAAYIAGIPFTIMDLYDDYKKGSQPAEYVLDALGLIPGQKLGQTTNELLNVVNLGVDVKDLPEDFKYGGRTFSSGGEKHRVYEKESPTGNGEGVKGHIMVTHPTMDKGKWDTIDLTEKSGARTVAQGVAATKKWHEENPEYQKGGPTMTFNTMPIGTANIGTAADNTAVVMNTPRGPVVTGKANAPKIKTYPHSWKQVATDLVAPAAVTAAVVAPEVVAPIAALGEMAAPYVAPIVSAMEAPIAGGPAWLTANNMLTAAMIPGGAKALSFLPADVQSGNLSGFGEHALDAGLSLLPLGVEASPLIKNATLRAMKALGTNRPIETQGISNASSFIDSVEGTESFIDQALGELIRGKANRKSIKEGNKWLENWIKHPTTQAKIDASFPKKLWIGPNGQYDLMRNQSKNFKPNSKEYSLFKQMDENLQQYVNKNYNQKPIHFDNSGVSYVHSKSPYSRHLIESGIRPTPTRYGSWISRSPFIPQAKRISTTVHEGTHDWVSDNAFDESGMKDFAIANMNPNLVADFKEWENLVYYKGIDPKKVMGTKRAYNAYLANPTEQHARIMELRKFLGLTPDKVITPERADDIMLLIAENKTPITSDFIHVVNNDPIRLANLFNKFWAAPLVATGAATPTILKNYQGLQQQKNGGWLNNYK